MPRKMLGKTVFDAAIDRMIEIYDAGHRVVVSFSGGKDSGCALEVCVIAAQLTGRLPVEVIMRDEEIMFPGTFEYAMRVAERPEIDFHWIYANQPVINIFNREMPYFWVFDPLLPPEQWVRQPPDIAYRIDDLNIDAMTVPSRFPPAEGKTLFAVIGLRTQESRGRLMGLHSSGGYLTKPNQHGVRNCRPIYDWKDGDVWKAIRDNGWDYNEAYDVMARMGVSRHALRIAPPTMNAKGADHMKMAASAWPQWFERVAERLPGTRAVAKFGMRAVHPQRKMGETWQEAFHRLCVDDAPDWIAERCIQIRDLYLRTHPNHSSEPFPEIQDCPRCYGSTRSWKKLTLNGYNGDPFSIKWDKLPYIEPEFFREGAGTWGGTPGFK